MNWDYMMNGWNGWMGGWMWIPLILVVALLTLAAIAAIRSSSPGTSHDAENPLAIAARRLARSEISKDEYEKVRATLAR